MPKKLVINKCWDCKHLDVLHEDYYCLNAKMILDNDVLDADDIPNDCPLEAA